MKKLFSLLLLTTWLVACTGKKEKATPEVPMTTGQDKGLVTYSFKVNGLQDSVVSDSIWRIIFQVQGVDKLILSKNDSSAVFTVDPKLVTSELLKTEITRRGGFVLK
jgi:hypothetical protein